jgi:hypothetical protein
VQSGGNILAKLLSQEQQQLHLEVAQDMLE